MAVLADLFLVRVGTLGAATRRLGLIAVDGSLLGE